MSVDNTTGSVTTRTPKSGDSEAAFSKKARDEGDDDALDVEGELSMTFLQQALLTFTYDPLHLGGTHRCEGSKEGDEGCGRDKEGLEEHASPDLERREDAGSGTADDDRVRPASVSGIASTLPSLSPSPSSSVCSSVCSLVSPSPSLSPSTTSVVPTPARARARPIPMPSKTRSQLKTLVLPLRHGLRPSQVDSVTRTVDRRSASDPVSVSVEVSASKSVANGLTSDKSAVSNSNRTRKRLQVDLNMPGYARSMISSRMKRASLRTWEDSKRMKMRKVVGLEE